VTTLDTEISSDSFEALVARLSEQSIRPGKHFDAYVDVAWDDHPIDQTDPRWELSTDDPLGATEWYRSQPQDVRARIGLHGIVSKMKTGLQFEGVLKRGLLEYALHLPNNSPEFRYAYHEVIEEAQHSLMFQEFVNRSGIDVAGMPKRAEAGASRVIKMGKTFPEMFFIFVLGGEDPIDHLQREVLRKQDDLHPLLERIMRIHVTEEARHLSFARHWLKQRVPKLGPIKKTILAIGAPLILGEMGGLMMKPSDEIVRLYGIPSEVIDEAYANNPAWKESAAVALRKVRILCRELDLINPLTKRIWQARNIWADDSKPAAA
jgi:hypothetical protein